MLPKTSKKSKQTKNTYQMNINDKQQALIEKYLDKNLSEIQRAAFEKELEDELFRKQLLFQAQLIDAHRVNEKEKIIKELDTFAQANKKVPKSRKYFGFLLGLIGLSIVLFSLLYVIKPGESGEELFAEYFIELPADVNTRGEIDDASELYKTAMQSYLKGEYDSTLIGLQKIEERSPKIEMYSAMCRIHLGQDEMAEQLLEPLLLSGEKQIEENAQFYKALLLIKKNEITVAKTLLAAIIKNENHLFYSKSKELLRQLDDF